MIVIILPEGSDKMHLRDCTPFKVYDCTLQPYAGDPYKFTDDRGDRVGINGRSDGIDYLIL